MKCLGSESNEWHLQRSWRLAGVALVVVVCNLMSASNCFAETNLSVRFGIERIAKVGCWIPIEVPCDDAVGNACEVEALDPDGIRVVYPLTLKAEGQGKTWAGLLRCGRLDSDIVVKLLSAEGQVITQRRLPVREEAPDSVTLARQSVQIWAEIGLAADLLSETPQFRVARWKSCPSLVEIPQSMDGLDGVVLTSQTELPDAVAAELHRWLRHGGQVLLQVTTDRDEFEKSRWAEWLRGAIEIGERTRIGDLGSVESFTGVGRKIPAAKQTSVTTLSVLQGRVLVSSQVGPLVARTCIGFGQVTVCGLDVLAPPISRWDGRDAFVRRLMFRGTDSVNSKTTEAGRLSQSGITDLASQWRAAAIEIPEVVRPSMWGVLGLLMMYSLLIGPLDYLLVHKFLQRPTWTWATLPLLVAVASFGTLCLARSVNGTSERLTQLDVLDLDVGRQEATSRSWVTTYATEHQLLRVSASPRRFDQPKNAATDSSTTAAVSWLGFPENAPGGLYRPSGVELGHTTYRTPADHTQLEGIPLAQWSSKSLASEVSWTLSQPLIDNQLVSPASGELAGQMVHHFPSAIQNWVLAYDGRIFRPHPQAGEAATKWLPDQPWKPNSREVYSRELRGFLTRTKATKRQSRKGITSEDILLEQERYNPLDLDPSDILQMLTWHEAAGGKAYTGLDHASLHTFDLTSLLTLDRAVLIGRVEEPQNEWRFQGEIRKPSRFHGFVRLLLPVTRQNTSGEFRVLPKFENTDITIPPATPPVPANKTDGAKPDSASETKSP